MQSDDVIWSVINTQFCSYKVKYVPLPYDAQLVAECFPQNYDPELL